MWWYGLWPALQFIRKGRLPHSRQIRDQISRIPDTILEATPIVSWACTAFAIDGVCVGDTKSLSLVNTLPMISHIAWATCLAMFLFRHCVGTSRWTSLQKSVWTLDHMYKCLVTACTSRALSDVIPPFLLVVHNWQPSVHDLATPDYSVKGQTLPV